MRRLAVLVAMLCPLVACERPEPPASPATLGAHMEAAGGVGIEPFSGVFVWGADLGFEKSGCCGLGAWGTHTSAPSGETEEEREETEEKKEKKEKKKKDDLGNVELGTDYRIDGGLEATGVVPTLDNRLRLRLRTGVSTTTKDPPLLGRTGYTASGAALFRIADVVPPKRGGASVGFDALVGYSLWAYRPAESSAGAVSPGSASRQGEPVTTHALLVGVRLGADYGIELE